MDWKTGRLPLNGLRVIDWSVYWAGPYLSMTLHDLGAEVIKVESPSSWDPMRTVIDVNRGVRGTQKPMTPQERSNISQHFNEWNRGKLGLAVELREHPGAQVLLDLVRESDIFVENHRPHVKEKLRITYDDLREVKPDLIYVSLSGYGQTLPDRDAMALGSPVEVASGLFSLNGYLNDPTPAKTGFSYGDPVGALTALSGAAAGAPQARRTGEGAYLDIALRDSLAFGIGASLRFGPVGRSGATRERPRGGGPPPRQPPPRLRPTGRLPRPRRRRMGGDQRPRRRRLGGARRAARQRDVARRPALRHRGRPPRASRRARRRSSRTWTRTRPARAIEIALQEAGVPAAAVLNYRQLRRDPQVNARGMFREITHPAFGREVRAASLFERGQTAPPSRSARADVRPAQPRGPHPHPRLRGGRSARAGARRCDRERDPRDGGLITIQSSKYLDKYCWARRI